MAGTGPYFYLPKMQSHLEARLWNDVFLDAQARSSGTAGAEHCCVVRAGPPIFHRWPALSHLVAAWLNRQRYSTFPRIEPEQLADLYIRI